MGDMNKMKNINDSQINTWPKFLCAIRYKQMPLLSIEWYTPNFARHSICIHMCCLSFILYQTNINIDIYQKCKEYYTSKNNEPDII